MLMGVFRREEFESFVGLTATRIFVLISQKRCNKSWISGDWSLVKGK